MVDGMPVLVDVNVDKCISAADCMLRFTALLPHHLPQLKSSTHVHKTHSHQQKQEQLLIQCLQGWARTTPP